MQSNIKPLRASKDAVHGFAEDVAKKIGYQPGASLDAVVTRLGGRIEYSDLFSSGPDNAIKVRDYGKFTIYLSSLTSHVRDRFTLAHELGHYFLHYPPFRTTHPNDEMVATRNVDDSDEDQKRSEWEANWFAAAFLMPKDRFVEAFKAGGIVTCAEAFGVSSVAAEVRAKSLGLQIEATTF